jgi:hypothetical protein
MQGGEGGRRKRWIAVGTVVAPMNLGNSSHGNGVRSAKFLRTLFYAKQALQRSSIVIQCSVPPAHSDLGSLMNFRLR